MAHLHMRQELFQTISLILLLSPSMEILNKNGSYLSWKQTCVTKKQACVVVYVKEISQGFNET